jgi:4-amino-4-deoxy-L-arabinose transferase-like glycosyltransferase
LSSLGWLALILVVGLALRLVPVLCHGDHPVLFMDSDSQGYHRLACGLLAGHGYTWDEQPPYTPNLYRPPGFPLLLLGLYALVGPSVAAAIAWQALIGTATILLTFFLVRSLNFSPRLALLAAAIQALDPVAIQYSNLLLTEVYTSPLVLLAALCVVRYRSTASPRWLLATGAIFAAGIMIHPVLLFLPLLLLAAPLLSSATRTLRQFGVALGSVVLALMPASAWIVRNWYVGDFVGISAVTAVNILKYKAAGVEAELRGTSRAVERDRLTRECETELPPDATRGQRYRLWQQRGSSILLAHPLTYARIHARGMLVELIGPERDHTTRLLYGSAALDDTGNYDDASIAAARTQRRVWTLEVVRYGVLLWQGLLGLGLVIGTWQVLRQRPGLFVLLLLVPLYVLALSGGPEASPRFRVIYLPVFSLLTAAGADAFLTWWRRRRTVSQPAAERGARSRRPTPPQPIHESHEQPSMIPTAQVQRIS